MGKICCACELDLPESEFYKCTNSRDGLGAMCKRCKLSYTNARNFPVSENPNRQKWCAGCKQHKPATLIFFSPDKRNPDGMTYSCKDCLNQRTTKRNNTHRETCSICHRCQPVSIRMPDGNALCNDCRRKSNPEACCKCQKIRPVKVRSSEGLAICSWCYQKGDVEKCSDCGKMRVPNIRLTDGTMRCSECQRRRSPEGLFKNYINSARKKGLQFSLSVEMFEQLVSGPCFYCGSRSRTEGRLLGVDRVDNTKGYIEGNVVSCCWDCNSMKGTKEIETFLTKVRQIANNLPG